MRRKFKQVILDLYYFREIIMIFFTLTFKRKGSLKKCTIDSVKFSFAICNSLFNKELQLNCFFYFETCLCTRLIRSQNVDNL